MTDDHPARRVTLQRHILESQQCHPGATGDLSVLLTQLAYAGKIFAHALGRAPLVGRLERNDRGDIEDIASPRRVSP